MLDAQETFVYCVVYPVCVIFAYKKLFAGSIGWNIALWSVPMLLATHALSSRNMTLTEEALLLVIMELLFVAFAYAGYRAEAYLKSRFGS